MTKKDLLVYTKDLIMRSSTTLPAQEHVGKYIVHLDRLSFDQAEAVLARQKKSPRKSLGQIVLDMGFTADTGIVSLSESC